jgi:hypothetical protein
VHRYLAGVFTLFWDEDELVPASVREFIEIEAWLPYRYGSEVRPITEAYFSAESEILHDVNSAMKIIG